MLRNSKTKFNDEDINPCLQESKLSLKCLEDEFYDYSKCQIFFDNYKNCKQFWGNLSRKRNFAGISPAMPTKTERDKIMRLKEKNIHVISAQE